MTDFASLSVLQFVGLTYFPKSWRALSLIDRLSSFFLSFSWNLGTAISNNQIWSFPISLYLLERQGTHPSPIYYVWFNDTILCSVIWWRQSRCDSSWRDHQSWYWNRYLYAYKKHLRSSSPLILILAWSFVAIVISKSTDESVLLNFRSCFIISSCMQ